MAKSKSKSELSDSLANTLADSINKQFKGQALKTAFFLAGDNDAPTHVTEFISSGCSMLDLAISNRPNGGFPVGRITEITGLEASGKSLLAAHTLAETQKRGGLAVYIDTEAATSAEFLEAIGADLKTMLYVPLETIEEIFDTNQLRTKLGVSFGDQWTTAGGKAIPFHASVRLRLKNTGQIKAKINGVEQIVGSKTNVQVVKNRIGPPHRKVDYEIYYDSGIDNYGGWLAIMKTFDIVTQAGAHYTLQDVDHETGETFGEVKFQSKNFVEKVIDIQAIKDRLYKRICDAYIFKYQAGIDGGIDDVIITDEVIDEEG
jgi:RecA/RadA recombinase